MKMLEILLEEHRLLFRVLMCLERVLGEAVRFGHLDTALAARIVTFLERFADGCHQDKEEEILFPMLMENTPAETGGVVRELFGVHGSEHRLLGELRKHLEAAAGGDAPSLDLFVERGHAYVALQWEHAQREERMLMPLAKELLGRADDAEMLLGFRRIEQRHFGSRAYDPGSVVDEICARTELATGTDSGTAGVPRGVDRGGRSPVQSAKSRILG